MRSALSVFKDTLYSFTMLYILINNKGDVKARYRLRVNKLINNILILLKYGI